MIVFLYPFLFLLLLLPFAVRYLRPAPYRRPSGALRVPFARDLEKIGQQSGASVLNRQGQGKIFRRLFAVWLLLVAAAARPVWQGEPVRIKSEGRDMLLVTDISTSMLENDFVFQQRRIDRLSAVKSVVADFVKRRSGDRIGLILFGTRAYLQAPLTYDRNAVKDILWSMESGMAGNTTSIGDALGLALKTFKESGENLNNKVIVLLTDGENNDGALSLPQVLELTKKEGVKVYTIGMGGQNFSLANAFFGIANPQLDEKSLKQLAEETRGRYFRADNFDALNKVYAALDKLEPDKNMQNFIYPRRELYYWPLLAAFLAASVMAFLYGRSGR